MKINWQIKKLGEVCDFQNGFAFKSSEYTDSGFFVMRIGNVQDGYITLSNPKFVKKSHKSFENFILKSGDILISLTGNVGRVGVIGEQHLPAVINQRVARIFLKSKNLILKQFLLYFLESLYFIEKIISVGHGAAQQNISTNDIENLEIPLPSLFEQNRIVKILDSVFEKIAKAKENTEKNLKNSKELFESYLQSVFANPGDGWEKKTFKQVSIHFGRGKSKHRPRNDKNLYGGKYPFIQTGDVRNCNHVIVDYSQTYNEKGLTQSKLWPKGTICITIAANIAETGILNFDACFPDSVIGIVVNPKITETNFVEYLLQSFKVRLQAKGKGSAQKNINMATFENELFPFPSLSEQKSIVKKLDALSAETKKLEAIYKQKLADLEELKKSVLKKVFAGEL